MVPNSGVRIQRKTTKKVELFSLLNSIREDTRGHDKKENKKRNVVSH